MRNAMLCTLGLVLLAPAPARAADWAASFRGDAIGTYLDGNRPAVLVVSAGNAADPSAAAGGLRDGLRASGRASLVMDDAALGAVRGLDDLNIVKRAAGMPVQVVAIVRVFPGTAETAVVTLYDKQGKTLVALSATPGRAVPPRGEGSGLGVSREAASAVDQVLKNDRASSSQATDAEREYQRRHVGFVKMAVVSVYASSATLAGYWGAPYLGSRELMLDEAAFFRTVGRPDYADQYTRKRRTKRWLSIPGWLVGLGGAGMLTAGALGALPERCHLQNSSYSCIDADKTPNQLMLGFGIGLTALGLTGIIVAATITPMPTTTHENHRLAAAHNQRLRQQLKLPARADDDVAEDAQKVAEDAPRVAAAPTGPSFQIVPTVTSNQGGLTLRMTY